MLLIDSKSSSVARLWVAMATGLHTGGGWGGVVVLPGLPALPPLPPPSQA